MMNSNQRRPCLSHIVKVRSVKGLYASSCGTSEPSARSFASHRSSARLYPADHQHGANGGSTQRLVTICMLRNNSAVLITFIICGMKARNAKRTVQSRSAQPCVINRSRRLEHLAVGIYEGLRQPKDRAPAL